MKNIDRKNNSIYTEYNCFLILFIFLTGIYNISILLNLNFINTLSFIFIIAISFLSYYYKDYKLIFIVILDLIISASTFDFSSDGITYHHSAIELLMKNMGTLASDDIRVKTYPVIPWLVSSIGANILSLIIDSNHVNKFGIIVLAYLNYNNFKSLLKVIMINDEINLKIYGLLLAFPPVFFTQLFTGYTDYYSYTISVLFILIVLLFFYDDKTITETNIFSLILLIIVSGISKYQSSLFIIFIVPLLLIIIRLLINNFIILIDDKKVIIIIIFGLLLFIVHYIIPLLTYGTLIPTMKIVGGSNILFDNVYYLKTSRFFHFIIQSFSLPQLNPEYPSFFYNLNHVSFRNLISLGYPDLRFGANGLLYPIVLLLSFLFFLKKITLNKFFLLIYFSIFVIIAPGVGNYRYYSFIYSVSVFMLLFSNYYKNKLIIYLQFINIAIIAIASILMYGNNIYNSYKTVSFLNNNYQIINLNFGSWNYYRYIMGINNLNYKSISNSDLINYNCESLKSRVVNSPFHDEVLICYEK